MVQFFFGLLKIQVRFLINLNLKVFSHIVCLYTTLPHNLIKEKLTELIEQIFIREGSLYESRAFFLHLNNLNNLSCGHVRNVTFASQGY